MKITLKGGSQKTSSQFLTVRSFIPSNRCAVDETTEKNYETCQIKM